MRIPRMSFGLALLLGALVPRVDAHEGAKRRVVTWATNPMYPPYDWVNADGRYDGAAADLLPLLAPPGVDFKPVMVPWKRAQAMAEACEIDLLINIRITPDREKWLEFSKTPTFPNPIAAFMIREKAIPFRSWDELVPLKGVVCLGDAFGNGFDEYLNRNLSFSVAPNMSNALMMLDSGRVDYFVSGKMMGLAWLSTVGAQHDIVPLDRPISENWIHLGFGRKSPHRDLLAGFDAKLAKLKADGTLDRILAKAQRNYDTSPTKRPTR